VIQAGKADQSLLVRHIRGDEQPRMPNNRRPLSEKTIENIAQWVAQGAKLDEGQSASATLQSLAWSADRIARERVVRLSADERTAVEREALVQIMSRVRPTATEADEKTIALNEKFGVIGIAEKSIATGLLSSLEKVKSDLIEILKPTAEHALNQSGRTLVFVFQRPAEFVEFQRQSGFESTDLSVSVVGRLNGEWPMIGILVDSRALDQDAVAESVSAKTRSRSKPRSRSGRDPSEASKSSFRTTDSMAAEAYTKAVLETYKPAPAWLKLGLSQVMGRVYNNDETFYQALLGEARSAGPGKITGGWDQRSAAFLKDQLSPQVSAPLAYSLMEWLKSTQDQKMSGFVQSMVAGEPALEETLSKLWGIDRKVFVANWTNWLIRTGSGTGRKGR
jgi:hypothetical protein